MDELFDVCLPMNPVIENYSVSQQPHSVLIRSHSLNLRPLQVGPIGPSAFGVMVGVALPFVHVVRFNGRCFLHNGYHRATAAALAGAPEIPCVFRDVAVPEEIGIGPGTFDLAVLESADPPTIHHFASGQAHPVDLLIKSRTMQISWTDWVVPEF